MEEEILESVASLNSGTSDTALIVVPSGGKDNEQQGHSPSTLEPAKILGYGTPANANDEYLRIGKTTSFTYLSLFCEVIINHFGPTYLRKPNDEDVRQILRENEERGFTGMLDSLDCSQNDINVLHKSPLFEDLKYGISPSVRFMINGHQYTHGYYLADGNYPKWSTLVQCYRQPPADAFGLSFRHFNDAQMALRKDVEQTRRDSDWTNYEDEDLRPEIRPHRGVPARDYGQMTNYIQNRNLYEQLRDDLRLNLWAEHGR
ncbi:uncharacterized protein LOC113296432 [Papaver somniferum]|uniref:uncharacterized protein LOC113296432 n=1 Tax=Papaver somniferum TaxID=3469 RepID=UPI000E6F9972|nr:uncharacterized protein LOC113296432 [Papaver somniferum]